MLFLPTEERSVPVAPQRTGCNRTPHCRAAPQTICLRSLEEDAGAKKQLHRRREGGRGGEKRQEQNFPLTKQSALVHKQKPRERGCGWCVCPVLLSDTAAHLTRRVLMAEECAPTSRVHSTAARIDVAAAHSCAAGGGEEYSSVAAAATSGTGRRLTV